MPSRTFTFTSASFDPITWEDLAPGQFFAHEGFTGVLFFMDYDGVIVIANEGEFDIEVGGGVLATDEEDFIQCTGEASKYWNDEHGCYTGFVLLDPVKFEFTERA
jgi:hypothetical protein